MIGALRKVVGFRLSFSGNLQVLNFLILLLLLGVQLHKRDPVGCTYCMHMHKYHECMRWITEDVIKECTCCDTDVK